MNELPTMSAGTYGFAEYHNASGFNGLADAASQWMPTLGLDPAWQDQFRARRVSLPFGSPTLTPTVSTPKEPPMAATTQKTALRVIQVFVADPDPKLPADKRLLHQGQIVPTDATDEELFYELGIKDMLDKHNAIRIATKDKAAKNTEKDVFLEPIRVRDLVMTVVTLASFPERAPTT